jgi:hypothetical protein
MQKKDTNKWLDVQIVIATLAMTFVLALLEFVCWKQPPG